MAVNSDFSKGSVAKNIWNLALPMTAAQLVNILYNVVDRMYIGHIPDAGSLALTGLGLCLPLISIIMGFANLCGVGGSPLFSMARGRGDEEEAAATLGNVFTLLLILGAALTAVMLAAKGPLLWLFGASPDTFGYADDYLTIYALGTIFVMVGLGLNPFINAQGFARTGMATVAIGAAVNVALDPVFIFVLNLGVRGAALATVLSQAVSAVWVLRFLTGRRVLIPLRRAKMGLQAARVKRILSLGLSGFFVNLTNSLVQVVCNMTLQAVGGDLYVGVITVINSVREVLMMPLSGITNGSQPIMSYNYGAGRPDRVLKAIRFEVGVTTAYSALVWAVTMGMPALLIRIFNDDPALVAAGVPAFRIYFSMFLFMSLQLAGQPVFVSLGRAKNAVFFSLLRKAIINAPLTVLLAMWMGTDGVFTAEAISQLLGGMACFTTMYFTVYRKLKREINGSLSN